MDNYASSAKSLIFAAIIIEVVFLVIGIIVFLFAFAVSFTTTVSNGPVTSITTEPALPFIFGIISIAFIFGIFWILLDYFLLYKKILADKIEEAKSASLVLGIIQLIFGGLIPGILILVAYGKLADSVNYRMNHHEKEGDNNNIF